MRPGGVDYREIPRHRREFLRRSAVSPSGTLRGMKRLLSAFLLLLTFLRPASADPIPATDRIVILISIDGFPAWIWKDPNLVVPNLRRLAASGAAAERYRSAARLIR